MPELDPNWATAEAGPKTQTITAREKATIGFVAIPRQTTPPVRPRVLCYRNDEWAPQIVEAERGEFIIDPKVNDKTVFPKVIQWGVQISTVDRAAPDALANDEKLTGEIIVVEDPDQ